ncbi:hypothetical protein LAZ29_12195 [Cereibacter sphaeroides]|uniref:hypothetical protein n=1 Tax=Cereibacter sphaeroides TaxID=1063 RepID=UPI001F158129|nr:hypothetical protein [Cereibacter sphaeroides]MCE6951688.1 hypothetical protein [Cereibacter sphaeroides]
MTNEEAQSLIRTLTAQIEAQAFAHRLAFQALTDLVSRTSGSDARTAVREALECSVESIRLMMDQEGDFRDLVADALAAYCEALGG